MWSKIISTGLITMTSATLTVGLAALAVHYLSGDLYYYSSYSDNPDNNSVVPMTLTPFKPSECRFVPEKANRYPSPEDNNILCLFHGPRPSLSRIITPDGINCQDYKFFTVDKDKTREPELLGDRMDPSTYAKIPERSFDKVIFYCCNCCTREPMQKFDQLFQLIKPLLKDNCEVYILDLEKIVQKNMDAEEIKRMSGLIPQHSEGQRFTKFLFAEQQLEKEQ